MESEPRIRITCPKCCTALKVKVGAGGKHVRCPNQECGERILVPLEGTTKDNQPHKPLSAASKCYFCQKKPANGNEVKIHLHGNIKYVETKSMGRFVTFNVITITLPRCKVCGAHHQKWLDSHVTGLGISLLVAFVTSILGAIVAFMLLPANADRIPNALLTGGLSTFVAVFLLATIIGTFRLKHHRYFKKLGIKPLPQYLPRQHEEASWSDFPEIAAKLAEGWHVGGEIDAKKSFGENAKAVILADATDIRDAF